MPMTERFYSVNGQMMGYESGGVKKDFLTDHLGSITAEIDQTQTRTYDTRYSAYGRNNWSTGTGCGFGWVGSYGYRETGLFHMSHYVRARHYSYITGNWSTVDPLWPNESAFGYVRGLTNRSIDPSGEKYIFINCSKYQQGIIETILKALWMRVPPPGSPPAPGDLTPFFDCLDRVSCRLNKPTRYGVDPVPCLKDFLDPSGKDIKIDCSGSGPGCGKKSDCAFTGFLRNPPEIHFCDNFWDPTNKCSDLKRCTLMHELIHACGSDHSGGMDNFECVNQIKHCESMTPTGPPPRQLALASSSRR